MLTFCWFKSLFRVFCVAIRLSNTVLWWSILPLLYLSVRLTTSAQLVIDTVVDTSYRCKTIQSIMHWASAQETWVERAVRLGRGLRLLIHLLSHEPITGTAGCPFLQVLGHHLTEQLLRSAAAFVDQPMSRLSMSRREHFAYVHRTDHARSSYLIPPALSLLRLAKARATS